MAARRTFNVDPDTHIDSLEQAKQVTIEGTSKWSCKIAITGLRWSFAATNRTLAIMILLDRLSLPQLFSLVFDICLKKYFRNMHRSIAKKYALY